VTVPVGYNSYLDELIRERRLGFSETKYLVRVTANNQWKEAGLEQAMASKFGAPFPCANAIVVGYFIAQ
jgi:hypothetical protein